MVERVAEVRQIAKTKRKVTPKLSGNAYAAATKAAKPPPPFRKHARGIEGFLFPATYEFTPKTTAKQLVARPARALRRQLGQGRPAVREEEEADAVRRPDHRLDGREGDDRARRAAKLVAAVIYNRLKARMPLGIDATIRYGLGRSRHRGAASLPARERQPVQHAEPHRPAADPDRESGPGLDPGRRASRQGQVSLLRAQARSRPSLLHGQRVRVLRESLRVRLRLRVSLC